LYGDNSDLKASLEVLKELASPENNGVYVSLLALNAIDNLGVKAQSLKEYLGTIKSVDNTAPARMREYVPRLLSYLTGKIEE